MRTIVRDCNLYQYGYSVEVSTITLAVICLHRSTHDLVDLCEGLLVPPERIVVVAAAAVAAAAVAAAAVGDDATIATAATAADATAADATSRPSCNLAEPRPGATALRPGVTPPRRHHLGGTSLGRANLRRDRQLIGTSEASGTAVGIEAMLHEAAAARPQVCAQRDAITAVEALHVRAPTVLRSEYEAERRALAVD